MKELFPIVDSYLNLIDQEINRGGNGDEFLCQVGKFKSIRSILLDLYLELIARGLCVKIEDLPEVDKQTLWNLSKEVSEIREVGYVMQVCRCIHALGSYKKAVMEGSILDSKYLK